MRNTSNFFVNNLRMMTQNKITEKFGVNGVAENVN